MEYIDLILIFPIAFLVQLSKFAAKMDAKAHLDNQWAMNMGSDLEQFSAIISRFFELFGFICSQLI